ncbi:hypothetical protein D082_50300 (plasmid) [Synechocystis sp. PCC 6714]|nr:hypothetical protein D082_50300 [Synechocystis sp. PCC 6714]
MCYIGIGACLLIFRVNSSTISSEIKLIKVMKRDFIEVFRAKLHAHGIKGKFLAAEAGRTPQNISEVLNRKVSPSIDSLNELIDAADRLSPGFADDFYASLSFGALSPELLVRNLDSSQLAALMFAIGQRIQTHSPQRYLEVG